VKKGGGGHLSRRAVISNLCINYLSVFEVDIAKSYIYI
jgi:hypothetical protein